MVNLDLAYLKDWSKRWLVKFNQNKTEIMVRAASVCTFSKRFELNWPQLNQTSDAYSKIGLINVK
jgi:phosphatidylserine decarboxylase